MATHIPRLGAQTEIKIDKNNVLEGPTLWSHFELDKYLGSHWTCKRLPDGRVLFSEQYPDVEQDAPGGMILFSAEESQWVVTDEEYVEAFEKRNEDIVNRVAEMSLQEAIGIAPDFLESVALERAMSTNTVWGVDRLMLILFAQKMTPAQVFPMTGELPGVFLTRLEILREKGAFNGWHSSLDSETVR